MNIFPKQLLDNDEAFLRHFQLNTKLDCQRWLTVDLILKYILNSNYRFKYCKSVMPNLFVLKQNN